jgi:hypothetical protein
MKRILFASLFIFSCMQFQAQETVNKGADSLYREDQFYIGITYNLLSNKPNDISQAGFSPGFHFGFIRDMPINKDRDIAIGVGIGYSANAFNENLLINKDTSGNAVYSILNDSETYTKNKFSTHLIELPIEFRWRTSTPTEYNFWRIYAGFKVGYIVIDKSKHEGDLGSFKYKNIKDFNSLQYGLTISAGYNTWNLHLYYALNPMFSNEAVLDGSKINTRAIKVGLMFYIL